MKRSELAHILRAASAITSTTDILIVGSQSILGSFDEDDLPDEAVGSIEADVAFLGEDAADKALAVDGAIGEDSASTRCTGTTRRVWRSTVWSSCRRGGRTAS